ncbi:MAG: PaaI family thioesterase [Acidobacteria bacterium]|nr:PaaI family thioesterase [Acidobacteriota bacterium]
MGSFDAELNQSAESSLPGEAGWTPVDPFPPRVGEGSFVSGRSDGSLLLVRYFRRDADGALVGKVRFGPKAEGPPGCAHGGSAAALLDEAMGAAAWLSGLAVVAARLCVDFREMMPLLTEATFEARVDKVDGRKVETTALLHDGRGRTYAEATGLFITLLPEQLDGFHARATLPQPRKDT